MEPSLTAMLNAFDRHKDALLIVSGYRSYAYQRFLLDRAARAEQERTGCSYELGKLRANMYVARPGHSEHQLGTAVDLSVPELDYELSDELENTRAGAWLLASAHEFGFVLSYPKGKTELTGYVYEPWHLRWIGQAAAGDLFRMDYLAPSNRLTAAAYLERREEQTISRRRVVPRHQA